MKNKKRILSLMIAFAFIIALIPNLGIKTNAAQISGDGYTFDTETGVFTATTSAGTTAWKSDSLGVSAGDIKKVVIGSDVTAIDNEAFLGCTSLTSIDFSGATALDTINGDAFYECTALTSIDFSGATALQSIGVGAFIGCTSLTSVNFGSLANLSSIGEFAFKSTSLTTVDLSGCIALSLVGRDAFSDITELRSVNLLNTSLTELGLNAFANTTIQTLLLPQTMERIGDRVFLNGSYPGSIYFAGEYKTSFEDTGATGSGGFYQALSAIAAGADGSEIKVSTAHETSWGAWGGLFGVKHIVSITTNLSNIKESGIMKSAMSSANYTAILIPEHKYSLPTSITITKNGAPYTSDYTYDSTTGMVTFGSALTMVFDANGEINIEAAGVPIKGATPTTAAFTATGADSGTLNGVTADMEYSLDGGINWTDITGTTVNIASGINETDDILVRTKETATAFASDNQVIDILRQATPTATLTRTGADSATLENVTTDMQYSINGGTSWSDITATTVDIASGANETDDVLVRTKPMGVYLTSSVQTLQFAYAPTPTPTPGSYPITPVSPVINPNYEFAFTASFPLASLHSVIIDGIEYPIATLGRVEESSTKVILEPKFLKTLKDGEHTIIIVNNDGGTAATGFTIAGNASPISPNTGVYY